MNRLHEVQLMEENQRLTEELRICKIQIRRLQADKLEMLEPDHEGPTHAQINRMMKKKFKPEIVRG